MKKDLRLSKAPGVDANRQIIIGETDGMKDVRINVEAEKEYV